MINEITQGRFGQFVTKYFGIAGQSNPAPQVTPEITPVVVIANDRPENLFLSSERMCGVGFAVAAAAANQSYFSLFNPAATLQNPGVLITFDELIILTNGGGTAVQIYQNTTSYAGAVNAKNLDTRWSGTPQGQPSTNNVSPPGPAATDLIATLIEPTTIDRMRWATPVVLKPGTGIIALGTTVNQGLYGGARWRERPLNQFELALG